VIQSPDPSLRIDGLLLPVSRIGFAPLLHPPSLLGSSKVVPVLGQAHPPALADGLAHLAAVRVRTIILMIMVAIIRAETFTAMTALESA
jgi:hypothetical protein